MRVGGFDQNFRASVEAPSGEFGSAFPLVPAGILRNKDQQSLDGGPVDLGDYLEHHYALADAACNAYLSAMWQYDLWMR